MNTIFIMPDRLRSLIAAGEAVERPASVVKELVENSIDAGARQVDVEIRGGGTNRIRVSDDGNGMCKDDLPLAVMRHATSKIRAVEDLDHLSTLGFRGEALASIGAVSTLTVKSRHVESDAAWMIQVHDGKTGDLKEAARGIGTTVEVDGLFANFPVRLKFLRSQTAETAAIADIMTRMSLAHPKVGFSLSSDSRILLDAPPAKKLRERVANLFGLPLASRCQDVEDFGPTAIVTGLVAPPQDARSSSKHMFLSVGGRPVSDQVMRQAVMDGFSGRLTSRQRPVVFIDVDVAPGHADENVHPTKREVKFRDPKAVSELVAKAVKSAVTPNLVKRSNPPKESAPEIFSDPKAETMRLVGQANQAYLIVETDNGIRVFDQHALHERIVFDQLMRSACRTVPLATPQVVDLTPEEQAVLSASRGALEEMGFRHETFGGGSVVLTSAPETFGVVAGAGLFREILEESASESAPKSASAWKEMLASHLACRLAIKSGEILSTEKMEEMLALFNGDTPPLNCPHGRPTSILMTRDEMDRRLGRR